jgi:ClpP class serine protease
MWLIHDEVLRALREAKRAGFEPTAEQRAEFDSKIVAAREGGLPRNMRVAGDVAEIRVEGVLTKSPDFFAMWFGGGNTTYADIQTALAIAKSDPTVRSAVLYVDSPGGTVDGLFDTLASIEAFKAEKKLTVKAANALSAAYAIAALAGKIEAANAAASFGSVGVAVAYYLDDSLVELTNSESPDKRPDLSTEEGKAVVVRYLDAIHELFVDAIARGRGTTSKDVTEGFGRGASLLAGDAKQRGMIDSIAKPALRALGGARAEATTAAGGGANTRKTTMNEEELRAQFPQLYAAVFEKGKAEGSATALAAEKDRVAAHITMGEKSGDMKTALEAIRSGAGMTQELTAKYLAAAMDRATVTARQADSDAAGKAVDGAPAVAGEGPTTDLGDAVVAVLKARKGGA